MNGNRFIKVTKHFLKPYRYYENIKKEILCMRGMKFFTLIFMLVSVIISVCILEGIPESNYALIVLVIVCSSLILPALLCLVYIRGEVDELRLKKMIRMIKICMVYQILIVPVALVATLFISLGAFMIIYKIGVFAVFAAISSNYLLIITKMQYQHLIALNKESEQ